MGRGNKTVAVQCAYPTLQALKELPAYLAKAADVSPTDEFE